MSFCENLFAYSTETEVIVRDLENMKQKLVISGLQSTVSALSFSLNNTLAFGNEKGEIMIWDL
jgi:hypothetical protein